VPFGHEFVDQAPADDVELPGDDREDRRVIGQGAAIDRYCFKRMIGEILDMRSESVGELLCQRQLWIGIGSRQQPTTCSFEYRHIKISLTRKIVIKQSS